MGGELVGEYGAYVWPSYGLTLLIMVGLLALSLTRMRRLKRELSALERAQGGRRRRGRDAAGEAADDEET